MLSGSPPMSVEFAADSATATLEVQTVDDDMVDETTVTITATITAPDGFQTSGRQLSATATVRDDDTPVDDDPLLPEPPWVSIKLGSSSTEGNPVTFTLTRGNDNIARTVDVSVVETGAMLSGSPPMSVEFAADSATDDSGGADGR